MRLALTGQPIDTDEAHRIGLVDRVAERGQALAAAIELAEVIARNSPLGLAASKRVLIEGFTMADEEFWKWQQAILQKVFTSKDAIEGATAFAEKRTPTWKGE